MGLLSKRLMTGGLWNNDRTIWVTVTSQTDLLYHPLMTADRSTLVARYQRGETQFHSTVISTRLIVPTLMTAECVTFVECWQGCIRPESYVLRPRTGLRRWTSSLISHPKHSLTIVAHSSSQPYWNTLKSPVSEVTNRNTNTKFNRIKQTTKLRGLSPRANYIDRAIAACRRS
jgi:hypothetical protein